MWLPMHHYTRVLFHVISVGKIISIMSQITNMIYTCISKQKQIPLSAVITRSNIVRYCINDYTNTNRISIRCWIHKRHPEPGPNRVSFVNILKKFDRGISTTAWNRAYIHTHYYYCSLIPRTHTHTHIYGGRTFSSYFFGYNVDKLWAGAALVIQTEIFLWISVIPCQLKRKDDVMRSSRHHNMGNENHFPWW